MVVVMGWEKGRIGKYFLTEYIVPVWGDGIVLEMEGSDRCKTM